MIIHQITFSPTGGTRKVCEAICSSIDKDCITTELCLKSNEIRYPDIAENDLVVIGMPVYGGRVPAMAVERLKGIKANNAKCAVVAVYGNRAYDDALIEMQDVATEVGFRVIAGISAIAEHSIVRKYGAGRPDPDDIQILKDFGKKIARKAVTDNVDVITIPGNHPYKESGSGPFPTAGDQCTSCGTCAENCPADAISIHKIREVDTQKCIGCMRCISICPSHARNIGERMNIITEFLKVPCATRKENELFI